MQQTGQYRIGAPVDRVWRSLNDPELLARCIDGCQSMEKAGDNAFKAVVKARVGPVSATFTADVVMTDLDPPRGYTLQASVKGGAAGFGKGTAKVALAVEGGATVLSYDVEGSVGGKLAQVGQRLIDGAARKMADDFFAAFGQAVAPGASEAVASPEALQEPAARRSGLSLRTILAVAIAAAAIAAALLLTR